MENVLYTQVLTPDIKTTNAPKWHMALLNALHHEGDMIEQLRNFLLVTYKTFILYLNHNYSAGAEVQQCWAEHTQALVNCRQGF